METPAASNSSALTFLRVPFFAPVLLVMLLAFVADAMAISYIALLAVDKVGMPPIELGALIGLSAISGIVATTIFGQLHDSRPVLWPVLLSLAAKLISYAICAIATEAWILLLNASLLSGISSASFTLLFAMAKGYLDGSDDETTARGMAALRICNSLSWAIGPAFGAVFIFYWNLDTVFIGAALLAGVALTVLLVCRMRVVPPDSERQPITLSVVLTTAPQVAALIAFHAAMFTGANAVSIVVGQQVGSTMDVGLVTSLCAIVEVLIMSVFVIRAAGHASRPLLAIGFMLFAVCFVMPLVWSTLQSLYLLQLPRAAGIAIISIAGMAALQQSFPGRAGLASALFGNSASIGLLLSAAITGGLGQAAGYWSLFYVCAGLSIVGVGLSAVSNRGDGAK